MFDVKFHKTEDEMIMQVDSINVADEFAKYNGLLFYRFHCPGDIWMLGFMAFDDQVMMVRLGR